MKRNPVPFVLILTAMTLTVGLPPPATGIEATDLNVVSGRQAGPVSEYFLADGDSLQLSVVQGTSIIRSWIMRDDQMPVAVSGTVRAYGEKPADGDFGSEYDLAGNWTGVDYPYQGTVSGQLTDGTTDGVSHNWASAFNLNAIYQFDRDWTNPAMLFAVSAPTGVTYDPTTGNLWVINHGNGFVEEYTQGGSLLSSFSYGANWMGALAYEPATDTLWAEIAGSGEILQYDKTGSLLQSMVIPGLAGYVWGGEFSIREPCGIFCDGLESGDFGMWSSYVP